MIPVNSYLETGGLRQVRGRFLWFFASLLFFGTAGTPIHASEGTGAGLPAGTTGAVIIGDSMGIPGGTAAVAISVATEPGESAGLAVDIVFDGTNVSLETSNCALENSLSDAGFQLSATYPPGDQPEEPDRLLRIGIFPPIMTPVPSYADGMVVNCDFGVASDAPVGEMVDLIATEPIQITAADRTVICGEDSDPPSDCDGQDGSILISEPTPEPTATSTPPEETPTATSTPTMEGPTNTPTTEVEPTDTPTVEVEPTDTPTERPTQVPPTSGPSFNEDDSCAIVPVEQSNPLRSLVLLIGPAVLLWGRRRRS